MATNGTGNGAGAPLMLRIGYLYGVEMNIYGDRGNIIALTQRCRWRGIGVEVDQVGIRDLPRAGLRIARPHGRGGGEQRAGRQRRRGLQARLRLLPARLAAAQEPLVRRPPDRRGAGAPLWAR